MAERAGWEVMVSLFKLAKVSTGRRFDDELFVQCEYCEIVYPLRELTRDHVYPRSRGGPNAMWNLALACKKCNLKKGNKLPESLPRGKRFEKLREWMAQNG